MKATILYFKLVAFNIKYQILDVEYQY